jgi:hypothetical protein
MVEMTAKGQTSFDRPQYPCHCEERSNVAVQEREAGNREQSGLPRCACNDIRVGPPPPSSLLTPH